MRSWVGHFLKLGTLLTAFFLINTAPLAGEPMVTAATVTVDPNLTAAQDAYMNDQAQAGLELAQQTLDAFPPAWPQPTQRTLALMLLDTVLHDPAAAGREPVRRFISTRLQSTIAAIESTPVTQGAMIWKLYNHGFVVRTPGVTLGFDLITTPEYLREVTADAQSSDPILRLAAQCDVLFISHQHADHADPAVARAFLNAGKPVLAPEDVWAGEPLYEKLTHQPRRADAVQELALGEGRPTLQLIVYPGHQQISETGAVACNVMRVTTPQGLTIVHTGDQAWAPDFEWIDMAAAGAGPVDILLPNCWTPDLPRMIRGFAPRLVIPGHENEMGHDISARIPTWKTTPAAQGTATPIISMVWGEGYHYLPASQQ